MYQQLGDRKFIIGGFFIFIVLIYIIRLFYLQVIDDTYSAQASAIKAIVEIPPRGDIYDRNGKKLVINELAYNLMVTPREVKGTDTLAMCEILNITKDQFKARIKNAIVRNSSVRESPFEKLLTQEIYFKLQEKMNRFNGFRIEKLGIRKYPNALAGHLLGYTSEVSKEKAEKDPYYREGDYAGASGIEKSYEEVLRGIKGKKLVIQNRFGKNVGRYADGKFDTAGVAGEKLFCTLDAELQAYGEKLMAGKKGSIVAIEPATGEILAVVSSPAYDPNLLVGRDRAKNFSMMYQDTLYNPLFNRATQAMYPPGSIFKLIDALIGQNDGVLGVKTVYPCAHGYPPMGGKPACHGHPAADLTASIQYSCNSYYSYVFRSIVDQKKYPNFIDGYEHWRESVMSFGVGRKLGYDIPYEKPGNVPSVKYYNKVFGKNGWRSNTIVSLGIGQAELTIVPIQMANVMCAIANKGFYYTPHIVKGVGDKKTIDSKYTTKNFTCVQNQVYYENVINGMQKVVESGTAATSKIKDIIICGKTGTAQNPHGKDHAVFVAFAPRDNPKIAIACIVENSGFGGTWAAPITSLMIEKYIKRKVERLDMEKRMMEADLIKGKNVIAEKHH